MQWLLSIKQRGKKKKSDGWEKKRRGQIGRQAKLTKTKKEKEKKNKVSKKTDGTAKSEIAIKKKPRL